MNLKNAIIQFLADELHLEASNITEDTNFEADLGLSADQFAELLQKLQDALSITLSEDQSGSIVTVGDLLAAAEPEDMDEEA